MMTVSCCIGVIARLNGFESAFIKLVGKSALQAWIHRSPFQTVAFLRLIVQCKVSLSMSILTICTRFSYSGSTSLWSSLEGASKALPSHLHQSRCQSTIQRWLHLIWEGDSISFSKWSWLCSSYSLRYVLHTLLEVLVILCSCSLAERLDSTSAVSLPKEMKVTEDGTNQNLNLQDFATNSLLWCNDLSAYPHMLWCQIDSFMI